MTLHGLQPTTQLAPPFAGRSTDPAAGATTTSTLQYNPITASHSLLRAANVKLPPQASVVVSCPYRVAVPLRQKSFAQRRPLLRFHRSQPLHEQALYAAALPLWASSLCNSQLLTIESLHSKAAMLLLALFCSRIAKSVR